MFLIAGRYSSLKDLQYLKLSIGRKEPCMFKVVFNLKFKTNLGLGQGGDSEKEKVVQHPGILVLYSWCHENGAFSVHSFNQHYLSIPQNL